MSEERRPTLNRFILPNAPTDPEHPYFTEKLKRQWLKEMLEQNGAKWLRENWGLLEAQWEYLQTL